MWERVSKMNFLKVGIISLAFGIATVTWGASTENPTTGGDGKTAAPTATVGSNEKSDASKNGADQSKKNDEKAGEAKRISSGEDVRQRLIERRAKREKLAGEAESRQAGRL